MSKQTQKARQDGKEMMLGALFLVDHAPECPEETTWHDFSNLTIAEHLKRHSYYHHQKGKRELATVAKMRSRILYICDNYATAEMPKLGKPDKEFKDKVDVLFGYGGIELVKEAFLERQGYEKRKFPESRLNKHVSEADTSGDARIDRRLEDTPGNAKTDGRTEDEMPEEISGSDASKTRSHGVGEEECQESRAAPPFIQPTLPSPANHVGTPLRPPDLSHTAPGLNILDTCESCNQSGAAQDEQVAPSRDEEPQLHDSIDPETQASSGHNGTSYVTEEASAAPVVTHSGPRNELVSGTKRKPMQDHGPHKRQCQTENATYQNNSNVLRLRLKAATPAQQRSKTPPTINGTKSLEAPQSAVAGREKQPEPQLAILNLDEQGRNMQSLYSAIQKAIDAILSSIGPIRNTPSPLHPESSGLLRDLYARCWGSRWEEVRVRQTGDHVFTTPQVTASLLSAFLYDRVLARGLQLEEIVSNVVEMGGSLGEALLEEFDIGTRGTTIARRARIIEAQKAYSKLAQDGETLQQQLKQEADSLANDASVIMAPHLSALSCSAKLFGLLSSDHTETDTLNVFVSGFAKVLQKALYYRLQLLATGREYAFTWPSPDEIFDSRTMQIDESGADNAAGQSIVLFTVFLGLEIKSMSSDEMESVTDAEAVVKVQRSENRF